MTDMDSSEESLEERTRCVRDVLAAVADDPNLDESLRESTEDVVEKLDAALVEGVEEPTPDMLFDAEPAEPPETGEDRPLDELFGDG